MKLTVDNVNSYIIIFTKLIIAKIWSLFYRNEEIWLISERGNDARDNGYFFFTFLKTKHPEIKSYYIISNDSPDIEKLSEYTGSLVSYRSLRHYMMVWRAKKLISTHLLGCTPDGSRFNKLNRTFHILRGKKIIFLQHGIIKDIIPFLFGDKNILDLFVCGAKLEYEFILQNYGYPPNVVQYTGLCRYDNLNTFSCQNQILIMPTWRHYIDKSHFEDSEYFKQYASLLTNPKLASMAQEHNMKIVFYPHYEVQSNISSFKKLSLPSCVTIAGFEYDVQTLLKESNVLITDFSSVYFDMAYMLKPVLYFQFDRERFFKEHYNKGYFEPENLGLVATDIDTLLVNLDDTLNNGCKLGEKYRRYIDQLFVYRDNNNCQRIYDIICSLK